ncbi:uncharacterized protein K444DRAFT_659363 [Hyaloscypha bicolor E]|uniref:Uncharacterized protein n=1 Tax=Hyaloscypha bicolor E TaxID=1095630 RepID=A0A2J6TSZ7_9HELO|nr:uncharacterized protein K444DRAFT_659363 [Hyaloscypha bicolor E]PMD66149.1 hypothetical protein K444DRAFT_659363 [Hyaloscypha bicolor E]
MFSIRTSTCLRSFHRGCVAKDGGKYGAQFFGPCAAPMLCLPQIPFTETADSRLTDCSSRIMYYNRHSLAIWVFSMVSANSIPGMPLDTLQEQMMIDYAIQLSRKDAPITDTLTDTMPTTLPPVKTHPEKAELVEVTDMSFYHSPRATEDFINRKSSVEAIFTVPARGEGQVSSPFANEVVVVLQDHKFVKGIQWQEESTEKQYITWYKQVQHDIFKQESNKGYTYVPEFGLVRITPAELFEERPVARAIEVVFEEDEAEAEEGEVKGEVNAWGQVVVTGQDKGAPDQGASEDTTWGQNIEQNIEEKKEQKSGGWDTTQGGNW